MIFLDSAKRLNTLDCIGVERIIRVAAKIKEENPEMKADLGFKQTLDKLETFVPETRGCL